MSETDQTNSTGAGNDGAGQGAGQGGAKDWMAGVPDDLRTAIEPHNFDGVPSLIKSYVHLNKKMGAEGDRLTLPGKDAKPEDWEKWDGWNRLGRPEDAKGYEFKAPEGLPDGVYDPKVGEQWAQVFHKAGLSKTQAAVIFNTVADQFMAQLKTQDQNATAGKEKSVTELKKVFGPQYDAKIEKANRAFKHAFGDKLETAKQIRLSDGTFLGDNVLFTQAFAALGELFAEDGSVPGAGSAAPSNPQEKLKAFYADPEKVKALTDKGHAQNKDVLKEWNELMAAVTGV